MCKKAPGTQSELKYYCNLIEGSDDDAEDSSELNIVLMQSLFFTLCITDDLFIAELSRLSSGSIKSCAKIFFLFMHT